MAEPALEVLAQKLAQAVPSFTEGPDPFRETGP